MRISFRLEFFGRYNKAMKIIHGQNEKPNENSIAAFFSPKLNAAAEILEKTSEEALHTLAVEIFESEGGLILKEDGI